MAGPAEDRILRLFTLATEIFIEDTLYLESVPDITQGFGKVDDAD